MKVWGRKRLFLGLLSVCALILAIVIAALLYLAFNPASSLLQVALLSIGCALALLIMAVGLGILAIVLSLVWHKPLGRVGRLFLKGALSLYPIALALGKMVGIDSDMIMDSFVEVNNQLVSSYRFRLPPERILVLLPHCIQKSSCDARINQDLNNCRGCGECPIARIIETASGCGVKLAVVTGGTLARKIIREYRPKAIVAVACQRDLSSGILDVRPLPVLGVRNIRPNGPCHDTGVDLEKIKLAISFFSADNN